MSSPEHVSISSFIVVRIDNWFRSPVAILQQQIAVAVLMMSIVPQALLLQRYGFIHLFRVSCPRYLV